MPRPSALSIYNTRTRRVEPFAPRQDPVRMYVCGPTVYDRVHLGHGRCYVFFDVVRRYLEFLGYRVVHIQNFTDLADSIAKRAQERATTPRSLADETIAAFHTDMDALHVRRAHHYPRVTDHVPQMVHLIGNLLTRGLAYKANGSVFLDTARAGRMGQVSGHRLADVLQDTVPPASPRRDPEDFVLWRCDESRGQTWESPFGRGRPGWHVECTAMALAHAPQGLDIQGGGMDLKLPHHDSETAVASALLGREYADLWIHNGFVTVWQEKMAKSARNFTLVSDVLAERDPEALRLFLLSEHYPDSLDYTPVRMAEAESTLAIHRAAIAACTAALRKPGGKRDILDSSRRAFFQALDDDLDTRHALVHLREASLHLTRLSEHDLLGGETAREMLSFYRDAGTILGVFWEIAG